MTQWDKLVKETESSRRSISKVMGIDWEPAFELDRSLIDLENSQKDTSGSCQNYYEGRVKRKVSLSSSSRHLAESVYVNNRQSNYSAKFPGKDSPLLDSLYRVYRLCLFSGLVNCQNQACMDLKNRMIQLFPKEESQWPMFREWVLVRTSCLVASGTMDSDAYDDPELTDETLKGLQAIVYTPSIPTEPVGVEVHELMDWMWRIDDFKRIQRRKRHEPELDTISELDNYDMEKSRLEGRWCMPYTEYDLKISEALERVKSLKICPNRLWNVILRSRREEFDLVGLMTSIYHAQSKDKFAQKESKLVKAATSISSTPFDGGHVSCTPNLCHFASIDTIGVKTLCKCVETPCEMLDLPERVELRTYIWGTANTGEVQLRNPGDEYVAISHVWSYSLTRSGSNSRIGP